MNIDGSRRLVAGATGELGSALSRALQAEGAELALAGRDAGRLAALGDDLVAPSARLDVRDPKSWRTAVDTAAAALGGLDCLVVSIGVPGFGPAGGASHDQVRALFGRAPDLPEPLALREVVAAFLDALREDRREVAWDLKARELITA